MEDFLYRHLTLFRLGDPNLAEHLQNEHDCAMEILDSYFTGVSWVAMGCVYSTWAPLQMYAWNKFAQAQSATKTANIARLAIHGGSKRCST